MPNTNPDAIRRMNEAREKKLVIEREGRRSAWSCPNCGALQVFRRKSGEVFCANEGCWWVFTPWEQFATLGDRQARLEKMVNFLEKRVREVWQRDYFPRQGEAVWSQMVSEAGDGKDELHTR